MGLLFDSKPTKPFHEDARKPGEGGLKLSISTGMIGAFIEWRKARKDTRNGAQRNERSKGSIKPPKQVP